LKGERLTLADYAELNPEAAEGLETTRRGFVNGEIDSEDFGLVFTVTADRGQGPQDIPLMPGGEGIAVTADNFERYITELINFHLQTIIEPAFTPFSDGYRLDGESNVMAKLPFYDLDLLISGPSLLDWLALQRKAVYQGGYTATSPAVVLFWKVFMRLAENQKVRMLCFMTGTYRPPVGGLSAVTLTITRDQDMTHIPVAHTCLLTLMLPDIRDEAIVRRNMRVCVENCEGFGVV
jgi:hypothetical protein